MERELRVYFGYFAQFSILSAFSTIFRFQISHKCVKIRCLAMMLQISFFKFTIDFTVVSVILLR